jgi:pimeloyl-ACP methyl ester carboxylesterase
MHAKMPNSTLVVMETTGHFIETWCSVETIDAIKGVFIMTDGTALSCTTGFPRFL